MPDDRLLYPFAEPLVGGRLVARYKRFLADIELAADAPVTPHGGPGDTITAHCANSGSMLGMKEPGSEVLLRHVPDPKRKLKWTWELVKPPGGSWVGCNTARPNAVVQWAVETGQVPGLGAAHGLRTEVKYGVDGRSRIDILLGNDDDGLTYVEVKNTTLADGTTARFPDAVTARGAKHMDELAAVRADGHDAAVVFFVNRRDCHAFDVARDIDAAYGAAYDRAVAAGVRMIPLGMDVDPAGWRVRGLLPLTSV